MLTREQRDKWAEELESGRWKQVYGELHYKNRFCCLGVLSYAVLGYDRSQLLYPRVLETDQQKMFIKLNDNRRLMFSEIAKYVRDLPVSDS